MSCCKGITTWILKVGWCAFIWRHNMPLSQAVKTYGRRCHGQHGYWMAGPLIVEW